PSHIGDIVGAIHHHAVDARIVGIGAVVLDVPGLVAEPLEAENVLDRLPGDAGQWHLSDEMQHDDAATRRHEGTPGKSAVHTKRKNMKILWRPLLLKWRPASPVLTALCNRCRAPSSRWQRVAVPSPARSRSDSPADLVRRPICIVPVAALT